MKPHVICHMASSVDGRTVLERWRPEDAVPDGLFDELYAALGPTTWLVGRATGAEYAKAESYPERFVESIPRTSWFARCDAEAYGVVLDPSRKIAWGISEIEGDPIVVVLSEAVSDAHLAGLRKDGVSYIFAGRDTLDLALALEALNRELGVERVLLQGGGTTNGAFVEAGLVDELSLLIFPTLDGSRSSPNLIEKADDKPLPVRSMKLVSYTALGGGIIWLRYGVEAQV